MLVLEGGSKGNCLHTPGMAELLATRQSVSGHAAESGNALRRNFIRTRILFFLHGVSCRLSSISREPFPISGNLCRVRIASCQFGLYERRHSLESEIATQSSDYEYDQ